MWIKLRSITLVPIFVVINYQSSLICIIKAEKGIWKIWNGNGNNGVCFAWQLMTWQNSFFSFFSIKIQKVIVIMSKKLIKWFYTTLIMSKKLIKWFYTMLIITIDRGLRSAILTSRRFCRRFCRRLCRRLSDRPYWRDRPRDWPYLAKVDSSCVVCCSSNKRRADEWPNSASIWATIRCWI